MFAVDVGDWGSSKLFRSYIFQAPQIDAVNSNTLRGVAYAESAYAAVFAEVVLIAHGVEQVLCQL